MASNCRFLKSNFKRLVTLDLQVDNGVNSFFQELRTILVLFHAKKKE